MTTATIRRVVAPKRGGWWRGLRRDQRWCLSWRSSRMMASAFWYFRTKRAARAAAAEIGAVLS